MLIELFHGSDHIVEVPQYAYGREDNDYGRGFYLTKIAERADEWALLNGTEVAVTNRYNLELSNLTILDLDNCGPLSWIAEVIYHRGVSSQIGKEFKEKIIEKYRVDTTDADIVKGYRADDSYGDVIEAFMAAEITVEEVKKLFYKGELGIQYMLKSQKAFDAIRFVDSYTPKEKEEIGNSINIARKEVTDYLTNRRVQIAKRFVVPAITVVDAIENNYRYVKDGGYYEKI